MPKEKKSKKSDIEKLRMILDNPKDEKHKKLISKEDSHLDSIQKRLSGETPDREKKYKLSSELLPKKLGSLEPQLTIYQKEEESVVISETKPVEPEEEKVLYEAEDLYEIEKIEVKEPEFLEVTPKEITEKEERKREMAEKTEEEELPEWTPVDTEKIEPEISEPPEEKEEIPVWEPIGAEEIQEKEITEDLTEVKEEQLPQPEKEELLAEEKKKPSPLEEREEEIPLIVREGKTDVFKDIKNIDENTAALLYENGFTSVDKLREATVKKLIKVGIKKRLAKKIKKEIHKLDKETKKKSKKMARKKEVSIAEKTESEEEKAVEWDSFSLEEESLEEELSEEDVTPYTYEGYSLYKKEIETSTGKKRTIRFFSKKKPDAGEPVPLPNGFEVKVNKKTGLPYLKKKK